MFSVPENYTAGYVQLPPRIDGRLPLYAGLYLPDFKNKDEIKEGIGHALKNGAKGVSLFGNITDEVLGIIAGNWK